jgi:Zn finger protein HypA/HybF involved in hydrogenase expression
MKAKLKIEETSAGFRCRVCGRRFRTEEAAFVHQSYDCSPDLRPLAIQSHVVVENRNMED